MKSPLDTVRSLLVANLEFIKETGSAAQKQAVARFEDVISQIADTGAECAGVSFAATAPAAVDTIPSWQTSADGAEIVWRVTPVFRAQQVDEHGNVINSPVEAGTLEELRAMIAKLEGQG